MWLRGNVLIPLITVALFSRESLAQQCMPISGSPLEACSAAGYNSTFVFPFELNKKDKSWVSSGISFVLSEFSNKNNCSVGSIGETILCSIYAPRCTEGNPKPNLPCRRVCSEFLKRCRADIDPFWLEYFVGYCTLLPNKTASSGECFEPQGFEKHYNKSTTGLLDDKCNRLIFPWCKGIGYEHTILKESTQVTFYAEVYGKNFTNDSMKNAFPEKDSEVSFWNEVLANNSMCASDMKKMLCADFFPPCFPDEGLAFYTICRKNCERISQKCLEIKQINSFEAFFQLCETKAPGESSHGFCRFTKWPKPMEWLQQIRDRRPKAPTQTKNGLTTPVIVAIAIIPCIVIGIAVLIVLLWRQRKMPWFHRFIKRADDARGFVKDNE